MTIAERNKKLKHFITCLKCEVSGNPCDDNCPTQYEAGHTGEIIENLEAISKTLEQEPNTWSLDDAREDFMHDVYSTLDFLPTNDEANRIIDSFDMVTSGIKQEPCEDCISRRAVIGIINFENNWLYDTQSHNANTVIAFSGLKSKVKALPSVNPQEQESVIDKIRAEIEQITDTMGVSYNQYVSKIDVLQIINKYKPESEVKE